ncbi:acyl-CoA dehydrogenase family protein [Mycobacterium sp. ACS4331]|uniref:acyl-CoA dehydrogenase family protein n=1 Tax=Mycobacterium sp. ACS4331 TaxID=1834121 RepID=UPI0018D28CD7|nr:acyl-CoA dehydrogenase family protein [Mycobacterium sp. ACS4331]
MTEETMPPVTPTIDESRELALFLTTTREFLDREMAMSRVRDLHAADRPYERQWWTRAAQLGWTSLLVPESLGGGSVSDSGVSDLAAVMAHVGRAVAPGPLIPVSVVAAALSNASNAPWHQHTVNGLLDGSCVAAWAVDEPGLPFGSAPATTAIQTARGYRIDGVKTQVESGLLCDVLLVSVSLPEGQAQLLVPADAEGVTVTRTPSVDLVRDYATVRFDGVQVEPTSIVGRVPETPAAHERQARLAQVLQCAETVGALDAMFDMTVAWAQTRYSFGRPLSSYQALKHRFADMKMQLESCRAAVAAACRAFAHDPDTAGLAVSAAKAYVGEYSIAIAQECVQLHGGIGVTWEHDLHVYLRRIEVNRVLYGTTEEHQEKVYVLAKQGAVIR